MAFRKVCKFCERNVRQIVRVDEEVVVDLKVVTARPQEVAVNVGDDR